jgi:predicted dehydrogenase
MIRIAMLGSGFIGRFYADSLQGYRSKDKIVSIFSRREESAKKFAEDYNCEQYTINMEEAVANPMLTWFAFPCPIICMKKR